MSGNNKKWFYDGPVKMFGQVITPRWQGETVAPSESKAKSNLAYQFKGTNKLMSTTQICLPGKLSWTE